MEEKFFTSVEVTEYLDSIWREAAGLIGLAEQVRGSERLLRELIYQIPPAYRYPLLDALGQGSGAGPVKHAALRIQHATEALMHGRPTKKRRKPWKLTDEKVLAILEWKKKREVTAKQLAERLQVSRQTIYDTLRKMKRPKRRN